MRRFAPVPLSLLAAVASLAAQQPDTSLLVPPPLPLRRPEGNRAVAVIGEPGNPMVAYVGRRIGRHLGRPTDGRLALARRVRFRPAQAIRARFAMAPSAHNINLGGHGETFFIRSDDRALGQRRLQVHATPGAAGPNHGGSDSDRPASGAIVISSSIPNVVLVCALGPVVRARRSKARRVSQRRRRQDWTRVLFVDPNTGLLRPGAPIQRPQRRVRRHVAVRDQDVATLQSAGRAAGLWTSHDGGVTWKRLSAMVYRWRHTPVERSPSPSRASAPNTVYALIGRHPTRRSIAPRRAATPGGSSRADHAMAERAPYLRALPGVARR